eukprot:8023595-Pyramimonas_sp.AAC.1
MATRAFTWVLGSVLLCGCSSRVSRMISRVVFRMRSAGQCAAPPLSGVYVARVSCRPECVVLFNRFAHSAGPYCAIAG